MSYREPTEIRDRVTIDWDVPIKMDDGLTLRDAGMRTVRNQECNASGGVRLPEVAVPLGTHGGAT